MGIACSEVDEVKESSEEQLTVYQDEFLSQYKIRVHCTTEPIARSSIFKLIEEEYKNEFNEELPISLHIYYNAH